MGYCGQHDIHYKWGDCPRCSAEERHRELLDVTRESAEEAVRAAEDASYRQRNPGEFECPHCKYVSLRSDASRCPLCREHIDRDYWYRAHAQAKEAADRRRVQQEESAAEKRRNQEARAIQAALAKRKEHNRTAAIVVLCVVAIAIATPFVISRVRQFTAWIGQSSITAQSWP